MGMTITEKILAAHADVERVSPGDLIQAKVDLALAKGKRKVDKRRAIKEKDLKREIEQARKNRDN